MRSAEIGPSNVVPVQPGAPNGSGLLGVTGPRLRVLLVEDDAGDAYLTRELLDEVNAPIDLTTATSLAQAAEALGGVDCVLLDLDLPDANGLVGLQRLIQLRQSAAICVLTGRGDEHLGAQAVGEGAQDYLIKGQVDGVLLARAVRYAVERKRADENARRLREVELLQKESARLERGLLPQPLLRSDRVAVHPFYRPGRHSAQIGGDFYDLVQTTPNRVAMMVGDVCGHGVDEAALGVLLRVAWRALVLAGVDDDSVLDAIEEVLISERRDDSVFATIATVNVDLDRGEAAVRLAGHPPPILLHDGDASVLPATYGTVLGVLKDAVRPTTLVSLAAGWSLLLYTDGLIEGRVNGTPARLDVPGLLELITRASQRKLPRPELAAWLVGQVEELNGGPLADDVAMLMLSDDAFSDGGRAGL